jgi:hypothetical protein
MSKERSKNHGFFSYVEYSPLTYYLVAVSVPLVGAKDKRVVPLFDGDVSCRYCGISMETDTLPNSGTALNAAHKSCLLVFVDLMQYIFTLLYVY